MAKKEINLSWLINKYLNFFQKYGMDEENIRNHYVTWKKDNEHGLVPDYIVYLFNKLLSEVTKQVGDEVKRYQLRSEIYLEMVFYFRKHQERKANDVMRKFFINRVKHSYHQMPFVSTVKILSSPNCCDYCSTLQNTTMTFEQFLEKQPLATSQCTSQRGCNCTYISEPVLDANGQVVRKY